MKIISWNVNSIRKRFGQLDRLISVEEPDVILLQELRVDSNAFEEITKESNYFKACYASGGRNGVAILSKKPMQIISEFNDRLIGAIIDNINFWSCYAPSGYSESASIKHKIDFLNALNFLPPVSTILGGDFNVCYKKNELNMKNPYTTPEIDALKRLEQNFSYHTNEGEFLTWWGYKENSFFQNVGMALDKILSSSDLKTSNLECIKTYRLLPTPSDHAPVVVNLL